MVETDWGIKSFTYEELDLKGIDWLTSMQKGQLDVLLENYDLLYVKEAIEEQNASKLFITVESEEEVTEESIVQNVKFNDQTKIEISVSLNQEESFFIKLYHLEKDQNGNNILKFAAIENGEIINEYEEFYEGSSLEILTTSEVVNESNATDDEVSIFAWYSNVPCVAKGCCVFNERSAVGNYPVRYKYCGAKCGSGTPVNATDRCCQRHDSCYGKNSRYPGRCACDRTFRSCLSGKGGQGPTLMRAAFLAKMRKQGC